MARTDSKWNYINGHIESVYPAGVDILINGTNKYLNFNILVGATGYGIRDNAGSMEFKNNGGAWTSLGGGGTGSVWAIPAETPNGVITVFTFPTVPKLIITSNGASVNGNGFTLSGNIATMDFPPTFIYALIT